MIPAIFFLSGLFAFATRHWIIGVVLMLATFVVLL
jgi:hypothetical protein